MKNQGQFGFKTSAHARRGRWTCLSEAAAMTQAMTAPPTWSDLNIKRARVDVRGQRRIHTLGAQPPDKTRNNLVRSANMKRQPRWLFSNQYRSRCVGVRCAQSFRTGLEYFNFSPPPPAGTEKLVSSSAARITSIPVVGSQTHANPPSCGIMWKARRG